MYQMHDDREMLSDECQTEMDVTISHILLPCLSFSLFCSSAYQLFFGRFSFFFLLVRYFIRLVTSSSVHLNIIDRMLGKLQPYMRYQRTFCFDSVSKKKLCFFIEKNSVVSLKELSIKFNTTNTSQWGNWSESFCFCCA